jgi:hypothetical protein
MKSFLTILWCAAALHAGIVLRDFAPPDIDKWSLQQDYGRIWRTIDPVDPPDTSRIVIRYYLKRMETPGKAVLPEWGGGGAIGDSLIMVAVDGDPFLHQSFYQVTVHELAHIAVARVAHGAAIPRWFNEGVAMMLAGEISFEEHTVLARALIGGALMNLDAVDSVNSFGRFRASLAYCESHLAALLLVNRYGIEVLGDIIDATKKKGDFWAGVDSVVSLTPQELQSQVRSEIRNRYLWISIISDSSPVWIALSVLFVIGVIFTKIRNRRRLQAMAQAESGLDQQTAIETPEKKEPPSPQF